MLVVPAIDVRGGRCVRLRRGDFAHETVYGNVPAHVARQFVDSGARRIHVVDLDAARGAPVPESTAAVQRVVRDAAARGCAVEVGGGVRDVEGARRWIDQGADAVIIGSVAARSWELAQEICQAFEGRVLLGLDVRAGLSQVQGWTQDGAAMTELLRVWHGWPARGLVYTDTSRDGMLEGPNLAGLDTCRETYAGDVYLSGGVTSIEDIRSCQAHGAAGVVIGRALYEGRIDLAAALLAFPVTG
jgi:phosphoribosylformimino-5-aminoimidazole carboxamide ribotide isomerase